MEVSELSDFNETNQYYNELIDFSKKLNPRISVEEMFRLAKRAVLFTKGNVSQMAYYRIMSSNISLFISQLHERSLGISDDALKDISFDRIESINNIEVVDGEDTLLEKKKQIRNCLAHSSYSLVFDGIDQYDNDFFGVKGITVQSVGIKFDNGHIRGTIPFKDIESFAYKYSDAFGSLLPNSNTASFVINPNFRKARNKRELIDGERKVRIIPKKDGTGKDVKKTIYWLGKTYKIDDKTLAMMGEFLKRWKEDSHFDGFEIAEEELPEDRKEFLNRYIDYIGFQNARDDAFSSWAITDMLSPILKDVVSMQNLTELIKSYDSLQRVGSRSAIVDFSKIPDTSSEFADDLSKYIYEGPSIYTNNLLGYAYYCFNYVKGLNDNNRRLLFNLYDLEGLDGIVAREIKEDGTTEGVPVEEEVNPEAELEKLLREPTDQLVKKEKELEKLKDAKEKLEDPRNRNPKKSELIEEKNRQIAEKEAEIEEKKREIEQYKFVYGDKADTVKDSSNFFRHLRNSMAHGNYSIDYHDFKRLGDTTYTFRDYDPDTKTTFEVSMSAKRLEELISAFQRKVNECSNEYIKGRRIEVQLLEHALRQKGISQADIDREIELVESTEIHKKVKEGEEWSI